MATTTYFGWTTPDDTGLVKDGAAAIRSLGSAIDASMQDLEGGTSGQILTKNSATDMDFVWTTPASGGMTSIASGSFSGSSVSLTSIPGTYNDLSLVVRGFQPSTDGAQLFMRFNGDTASRYATRPLGTGVTNGTFPEDKNELTAEQDNGTTNSLVQHMIPNYANTTSWKISYGVGVSNNQTTTTNFNYYPVTNFYNQTAAITSITLFVTSGTFTAGSYVLYGVK
jgi:hypothetical protein